MSTRQPAVLKSPMAGIHAIELGVYQAQAGMRENRSKRLTYLLA